MIHTVLISVVSVIIVLGIMVLVHEFGHFIAAKLFGVRVEQFSIGFPPRLFGVKVGETDYCISWIPLGGYVKMTGETLPGENLSFSGDATQDPGRDPGALTSHPRWQRIVIGVAGPTANFVLALLLMTGFFMLHNEVALYFDQPVAVDWVTPGSAAANAGLAVGDRVVSFDSQPNPTWQQMNIRSMLNLNRSVPLIVSRHGEDVALTMQLPDDTKGKEFSLAKLGLLPAIQAEPVKVASVQGKSPAARAGVQQGDLLQSVDGHTFHSTESIIAYLQVRKGAPLDLVVSRNGVNMPLTVQPIYNDAPPQGMAWRIGFQGTPPPTKIEQMQLIPAAEASAKFCRANSLLIFEVLKRVLTARMSVSTLSGPIGIAQQTGQAWEAPGYASMITLMTVISLNLGVLNLLPFPILDGGMIAFLLIESVIRRDVDLAIKERIYQVGFVLIVVFFAYVIFNDITKLPIFGLGKP